MKTAQGVFSSSCSRIRAAALAVAAFHAAFFACAGETWKQSGDNAPTASPRLQVALTSEREMAELLPGRSWDGAALGEMASRIGSLPDQAAAELLWVADAAPPGVDCQRIFENAARAASPRVRMTALTILAGRDDPEAWTLLRQSLFRERDPEVVAAAVEGLAHLPRRRALEKLLELALDAYAGQSALAAVFPALRRVSGAELPPNPEAWRGWWRENRQGVE